MHYANWPKQKEAMQVEYNSLIKNKTQKLISMIDKSLLANSISS